jgi:soluble lytic murein transglycosylase
LEGATGLMQIMPQTGQNISKLLGEEFDRFLLYDRRVNIKFGTYYLSRLLDKFGGNEILALASYNGGPRNVENWLKRRWTDQMDLFVELIPLEQTRNYVRRVLTSYARYSFLYDKKIDNVLEIFSRRPLPNFKEDPSF